jgi:hypothetical protein
MDRTLWIVMAQWAAAGVVVALVAWIAGRSPLLGLALPVSAAGTLAFALWRDRRIRRQIVSARRQ